MLGQFPHVPLAPLKEESPDLCREALEEKVSEEQTWLMIAEEGEHPIHESGRFVVLEIARSGPLMSMPACS